MNANCYRLIFCQRTGMLIPVAEITAGAKKGNTAGSDEATGATFLLRWNPMFAAIALAAGWLCAPLTVTAQMQPDGTTQTTVSHSINGVPLINIANPDAGGLSHNRFTDFNVGTDGAIFNNSLVDGTTLIGGNAMKNPHLQRNATGILTEVTGTDISRIRGSLEVFGPGADLIIANPNGLDVNALLPASIFSVQREVAVAELIAPQMIVGAYEATRAGITPDSLVLNPGFEASMDRAQFARRQEALLIHSALTGQLDHAEKAQKKKFFWQRDNREVEQLRLRVQRSQVRIEALMQAQADAARRDAGRRDYIDSELASEDLVAPKEV